ncbi:MAG: ABC-2 family transporter protein [Oscillospiraceae bacterium]|nr:ABC-2 family transporter protein [Oscillospiraceae bacterium]
MKKYLAFFRMRLLAGLQYRAAALAGLSTQFIWGTMEILLYRAFWLEHPERFPMGMEALACYIWLQQAFLTLFAMWSWEFDLIQSVKTGAVAYELARPVDLYAMWMARSLALRLSRAVLRMLPVILLAALIPPPYGLRLLVSPEIFLLFLLSTVLMLLVVCAYTLLVYALTLWLADPSGIMVLSVAAADLLGGGIVPLPFLPGGLRWIAELSPFGSMQNVPLRIFSGDIPLTDIPGVLGLQVFWILVLGLSGYALTQCGLRRTVIAGG